MTKNEWIQDEIGKWEKDGVVPADSAARLRALYPVEVRAVPMAVMIFSCVGAFLVALGVIALLAANWDSFGRPVRTFLSFLPFVHCGGAALVIALRGWTSRFIWEPLGLLWAASVCTGILMVSQIYQVTDDFPSFVLACAAATLPVVYVTRATVPLALWPGLLAIGACSKWRDTAAVLLFWPLLFAAVPAVVNYWRKTPSRIGRGLVDLGLALAVAIGGSFAASALADSVPFEAARASLAARFVVPALFSVMLLAGARFRLPILRLAGFVSLLGLAAFILPYEESMKEIFLDHGRIWSAGWTTGSILAYAVALVAVGVALLVSTIRMDGFKPAFAFAALPFFVVTCAPIGILARSAPLLALLGLAVLVASGLGTLVVGLRAKRLMVVNLGTLILLYAILAKFFASDAGFTVKGIVMTALGVVVLAVNVVWAVRRRAAVSTAGKEASK